MGRVGGFSPGLCDFGFSIDKTPNAFFLCSWYTFASYYGKVGLRGSRVTSSNFIFLKCVGGSKEAGNESCSSTITSYEGQEQAYKEWN